MSEEKEAEVVFLTVEWSDGVTERMYPSPTAKSITIDLKATKKWGEMI